MRVNLNPSLSPAGSISNASVVTLDHEQATPQPPIGRHRNYPGVSMEVGPLSKSP